MTFFVYYGAHFLILSTAQNQTVSLVVSDADSHGVSHIVLL